MQVVVKRGNGTEGSFIGRMKVEGGQIDGEFESISDGRIGALRQEKADPFVTAFDGGARRMESLTMGVGTDPMEGKPGAAGVEGDGRELELGR